MKTDNELIAEFMGLKYSREVDEDRSDCGGIYEKVTYYSYHPIPVDDYGDQVYVNREGLVEGQILKEGPLRYDSSWDWLMPVVEKINKLDDQIHLSIRGIELIRTIRKYVSMVQIKDAHMYIVEFIKWHNELPKPKDVFDTGAILPEHQPEPFDGSAELDTPEEALAKIANRQEKEESQDELVPEKLKNNKEALVDHIKNKLSKQ